MVIRKDQAPVVRADEEDARYYGPSEWLHLSDEGGLTQFGAHVHTLLPGSRSSDRHWHEEEDEFLYVVAGEATVIEDDGAHTLRPGDAACWPAGVANAHQVVNLSGTACSYLILGSRAIPDVVHYPDREDVLYAFEDGSWRLQRTDGTLIKEGTPDWGGKRAAAFREPRLAERRRIRHLGRSLSASRLIHVLGSLCTTTTCRSHSPGVKGLRSHPRASQRAIHPGSCIWTSQNPYFFHALG
jgi:uncharacterized cupin superfamily protein